MPVGSRTRRPLTTTLAAAVLAGGMLATATAPPALAEDAEQANGYFVPGNGAEDRFYTMHTAPSTIRVTVAPFKQTGEPEWYVPGEIGPETEVEFSYDPELERGVVDLVEQRRVLAESGADGAIFTLHLEGSGGPTMIFGADDDLSDDIPGKLLGVYGPQDYDISYRPDVDERTLMSAPGSRLVYLQGGPTGGTPGTGTTTVVEGPKHGRLVVVPESGDPRSVGEGQAESTVYVADEGFTGKDTVTYEITDGTLTKTLKVTYSIGDERADDTVLDPEAGALPYDEARVWEALKAGTTEQPAPTPSTSVPAPAPPASAPAPAASTPAPTSSAPVEEQAAGEKTTAEAEHAKPEKVQTDAGVLGWLAAAGAVGAGALGAARPRLGLSR